MRIMATGDNHFCEEKRFDECVLVHDWIADQVHNERPDLFLLAGDIFERKSTPMERLSVANFLLKVLDECTVVMVRGNHDEDLELFAKLKGKHALIIVQDARVLRLATKRDPKDVSGHIAVAAMAWPNVATLRASGMDERTALQNVMRGLGAEIDQHDGPKLAIGHYMIDGSQTSHGQPLIGHSLNVSLSELAMLNCPLVLAGHVHMPQQWQWGDTDIRYCGSPYRTAFGEVEQKSIVMADWADARWQVTLLPTPARQMLLLDGDWGVDEEGEGWIGENIPQAAVVMGADVRFRYRVGSDRREAAAAAAERVRGVLLTDGAHSVKLEERVIAKTRARTPEISTTSSTAQQLETLWEARKEEVDGPRKARLLEKVAAIDTEAA